MSACSLPGRAAWPATLVSVGTFCGVGRRAVQEQISGFVCPPVGVRWMTAGKRSLSRRNLGRELVRVAFVSGPLHHLLKVRARIGAPLRESPEFPPCLPEMPEGLKKAPRFQGQPWGLHEIGERRLRDTGQRVCLGEPDRARARLDSVDRVLPERVEAEFSHLRSQGSLRQPGSLASNAQVCAEALLGLI